MRKYESLAFSAAAALTLFLTASCQKEIAQTSEVSSASCTVEFSMNEMATKTAMGEPVDNKYYPTIWSSDDNARITFYQNDAASTSVDISSTDDFKTASFTASFSEQGTTPFTYKAILAGKRTANDLPIVPAEQHPTAGSFDPNANVLVGVQKQFDSKPEKVDLEYKHAAVISRVCFTGIPDGLTIYGVQINAANAIAGAAKSVDYEDGTVDFSDASEKTISLIYDNAPSYSDGKFDAYFVAIPGTGVQINDIKLITDKGTFVKKNSKSSKTDFNVNNLKSVKVTVPSERTFYKATSIEAGQNYLIVTASKHALTNNSGSAADTEVSVSDDDSIVLSDPSNLLWNASASKDFTLKNGDYFVNNKSVTSYGSNPSISLDKSNKLTFNYAGTAFTATISNNDYHLYYNSQGIWSFGTTDYITNIFTSKLPLNLSFTVAEASYDIDKSTFISSAPILSGASSDVKYTSSDTNVATVNTDGTIKAIAVGTTTITASLASNSLYQAATASYTLTIKSASASVKYVQLTSEPSDWSGSYLIVDANKQKVFTGKTDKSNYYTLKTSDKEGNVITNASLSQYAFTISNDGSNCYLKQGNNYYYVNWSSSGDTGIVTTTTRTAISFGGVLSSGAFLFYGKDSSDSNKTKYLYIKSGEDFFKFGGSGDDYGVYLYKYEDPRTPQNLTFADYTPSIDLASIDTYEQDVKDAKTDVTYSISATPSDAATIDATTGKVTATKKGTAVITATATATKDYQGASASYTLTINNSASVDKYYVKFTGNEVVEGTYLVVAYNTQSFKYYAFDANQTSDNRQQVTPSSSKILSTKDVDAAAIEFTEGPSTGKFYFKTSKGYLYTKTGDSPNLDFATNIDEKYAQTVTFSNGTVTVQNKADRSSEYYLTYGNSKFSYGSPSTNLELYLLEGSASGKAKRNLAFEQTSVRKNIGDEVFTIKLNGITIGGVTYSSSEPTVATVSTTGEVTIVGAGTTTIKAECAETTDYKAGEASYTLTVTKKETYVKVTSQPESWEGTYLILSDDDKMLFDYSNTTNGSNFYAASLTETIADNTIVSSGLAKYEVEIIAFDSSSEYIQPNTDNSYWYETLPVTGWKVKVACESKKYLYSYGNKSPEVPVQDDIKKDSNIYYNGIYFNNGQIKMISTRGKDRSAKYLGYHSDNGFYYFGSTNSEPSERVHLYKKQ